MAISKKNAMKFQKYRDLIYELNNEYLFGDKEKFIDGCENEGLDPEMFVAINRSKEIKFGQSRCVWIAFLDLCYDFLNDIGSKMSSEELVVSYLIFCNRCNTHNFKEEWITHDFIKFIERK